MPAMLFSCWVVFAVLFFGSSDSYPAAFVAGAIIPAEHLVVCVAAVFAAGSFAYKIHTAVGYVAFVFYLYDK